jgi:hypothetical protein
MYCPQCGIESQSAQYCRVCGANLKVIGKAVSLSEAIARSDRGPLPKIKEMVKGLKAEHITDEVSRALDRMDNELAEITSDAKHHRHKHPWWANLKKQKTAAERREKHLTKGVVSFCSGIGLSIFLYFLSAAMVLKLPPHIIAQVPFEIEPVLRMIWLFGLLPATAGLGHILAGLMIRRKELPERPPTTRQLDQVISPPRDLSVTDHTTNLLT